MAPAVLCSWAMRSASLAERTSLWNGRTCWQRWWLAFRVEISTSSTVFSKRHTHFSKGDVLLPARHVLCSLQKSWSWNRQRFTVCSVYTNIQMQVFCGTSVQTFFCDFNFAHRYRHEFKSNELWTEIKLVLDTFAQPLTELFKVCDGLLSHLQKLSWN